MGTVETSTDVAKTDSASGATFSEWHENPEYRHVCGLLTIPHFTTELGETLSPVDIRFDAWGTLNKTKDNVVVICHALTGDSRAAASHEGAGWWSDLIGPGKAIDVNKYFVVATNVLGGCAGSTGPSSLARDAKPYGLRFPLVTIRDMVKAQVRVLDALGITGVHVVIGGSMGGMQAWEWPFLYPGHVEHAVVIAAHASFPPLAIGYNHAMRQAIMSDPDWQDGDYYGTGRRPMRGLATARSIGMLTYRTGPLFQERFGRTETSSPTWSRLIHTPVQGTESLKDRLAEPWFQVESYLDHHGERINGRFDANSYLYLTRAMDSHDIGRGRGGLEAAFSDLETRLTVVGIDQDYLYAAEDLKRDAALAAACGVHSRYLEMKSHFGHDAFLADQAQLGALLDGI
jgi:homoserine O-acetyltransferase